MRAMFQGGDRQAAQQKLAEIRKTSDEKLLGVLTPEQQGKWKELTGEPFKGEIVQPNFRGRNRAGGGPADVIMPTAQRIIIGRPNFERPIKPTASRPLSPARIPRRR